LARGSPPAPQPLDRLGQILAIAAGTLAVGSFALACFVPIYTDEIAWKIIQSRVTEDGGQSLALTLEPSCGPYSFAVPMLLYPFRWVDSLVFRGMTGPLALRLLGFGTALLWLALAGAFATDVARTRLSRGVVAAGLIALVTIGVMPFLLVISRPEQVLLIAFTCFLYPLMKPAPDPPSRGRAIASAIGGWALCSYALAAHPRAAFALPLMLLFIWRITRRPLVAGCAGAGILAVAFVSYRDFVLRLACPGDPDIAALFVKLNIGSALEQGKLLPYLSGVLFSLRRTAGWYINEFTLRSKYASDMLPGFSHPLLGWAVELFFSLLVVAGIAAFVMLTAGFRKRRETRLAVAGVGALWFFYFACVGSRILKFDYEAELMEPVMAMAALSSLWLAWPRLAVRFGGARLAVAARSALTVLLALSVASQGWLLINDAPYAWGAWSKPGYAAGQAFSITNFGYGRLRSQILATARLCGIDPAARPQHLVVDELTYFAFADSYQPFFMTYFDENGWRQGLGDPRPLWRASKSAGMVVACQRTQSAFADAVTRNGAFCCLPNFSSPS
jgi:hypothetical protein